MSRVRPRTGPTISLFPFLAVLLCTMGSLLVLLVLFSRSAARVDAAATEEARRQQEDELTQARDELAWRLEQLQAIRSVTADDLSRARMQLAGAEDDARKLDDELAALERLATALEQGVDAAQDDDEIGDLERRLAAARGTLDAARRDAATRPPAYAVVPYEGANGTRRRPLYIECCIDGVFLQPEGVRLGPADFEGPPGPGNPLASALRAAREHLARDAAASGDPALQPYPLLIVRPTGVMAYYAARESLQSWGSEFGYQFIDEDWTLAFPPRDPALADAEMRAVEEARQRMQWLAQVRPVRRAKPTQQFRAAPTRGGVMSEGGPSVLGDQSRWNWTEEQAAAAGRQGPGRGVRSAGDGVGGDGDVAAHGDPLLGRGGAPGGGGGNGASGRGQPGGFAGPTRFYAGASDAQVAGAPSGAGSAAAGAESAGTAADGEADGEVAGGGPGGSGSDSKGLPSAGASSLTAAGTGSGTGTFGGSDAGGGGDSAAGTAAASGAGTSGGTAGGGGPALPGLAGGQTGGGAAVFGAEAATGSLAGRRGSNWASLATQDRPIPLTRPIRLECAGDEFRILGPGGRVQSRIPIGSSTAASVDPLVREVHAEVDRWGLAGDRMYWKPQLVLSATVDGQSRRDDLERLLVDSGIDTRRSETRDRVRPLPPVVRAGAAPPVR